MSRIRVFDNLRIARGDIPPVLRSPAMLKPPSTTAGDMNSWSTKQVYYWHRLEEQIRRYTRLRLVATVDCPQYPRPHLGGGPSPEVGGD